LWNGISTQLPFTPIAEIRLLGIFGSFRKQFLKKSWKNFGFGQNFGHFGPKPKLPTSAEAELRFEP
jgi:hypothetical protein